MSRFTAPLSKLMTALAATCTAFAAACSGSLADPDPFPPGLLAIQLQAGSSVQLESVSYLVSGPGGFMRSGPVAVALDSRASFSFKVESLPPGAGYALSVDADATLQAGAATTCHGNTAFAIETDKSTAVSIRLQCDGVATTGSTNDDHTVNQCPIVKGLRAVPAGGPVGSDVKLHADIDDADDGPSATSYVWTSAGGMVGGSTLDTTFHCTRSGVSTVNLMCSDGDAACSDAQAFVYVVCTDAKCLAAHNCDALPDPVAGSGGSSGASAGHGHSVSTAGVGGSHANASAGVGGSAGAGGANAVISANAGNHAPAMTTTTTPTTQPSTNNTHPIAGAGAVGGTAAGAGGTSAADGGRWSPPMLPWPSAGMTGGDTHPNDDDMHRRRRRAAGSGGAQAPEAGVGSASEAGSGSITIEIAGNSGANIAGSTGAVAGNGGNEAPANAAGAGGDASANASGSGGVGSDYDPMP